MHPYSSRCFLAAALAAALPLISGALRAQPGFGVSVSYNGDSSSLTGMDALVAPIALYPDPLLGIMLPAATSPNDLQAAAGMQGDSGDWQPAVQDMAHYPNLLQWMASNIDWTEQLGAAFANNPSDVMNAIQDLRQRALANGALQSNGQILVINTDGAVQILPQSLDALYVPQYDPNAVFFGRRGGVAISFGAALPVGAWLGFFPSWHDHAFYSGDFYSYSRERGGWGAAVRGGSFDHASGFHGGEWHVARDAQIRSLHVNVSRSQNFARPSAFNEHTNYQANARRNESAQRNDQTRATEAPNAMQQRQAQTDEQRYAQQERPQQAQTSEQRYAQQEHARPAQTSEQRYAQEPPQPQERQAPANDQRYAQGNRQSYAQSSPERYAQSNESRTQAAPQRSPQVSSEERNAQGGQSQRNGSYAQTENRPSSTFAGDSARSQRTENARTSEQPKSTVKPATKSESKSSNETKPSKSDDKDHQQQ